MKKGRFITVEGIEGAGKSTVVKIIENWLLAQGYNCVLTREPGGTPIAENIRKILLDPNHRETIEPSTELLLFFAGRSQHISQLIAPKLQTGHWVVSDRFVDATYAYQIGGRKLPKNCIEWLENWIINSHQPDLTFLLDVTPETGLQRARARSAQDRIESETLNFFQRVRKVYLDRAKKYPQRIYVINAEQSQEKVKSMLLKKLAEFAGENM